MLSVTMSLSLLRLSSELMESFFIRWLRPLVVANVADVVELGVRVVSKPGVAVLSPSNATSDSSTSIF